MHNRLTISICATAWTAAIIVMGFALDGEHARGLASCAVLIALMAWVPTAVLIVGYFADRNRRRILADVCEVLGRATAEGKLRHLEPRS